MIAAFANSPVNGGARSRLASWVSAAFESLRITRRSGAISASAKDSARRSAARQLGCRRACEGKVLRCSCSEVCHHHDAAITVRASRSTDSSV
ncbi:hypothetical protein HPB47_021547 [Ixodes persulcatus]|uniref:Uncharacterized protein n=1 Tax=Ixodes persulcatus TaxID=34615 RepID=A0AC60QES0_IXOPE|nr:hypothetical protein HPB47_021547 [Ixodes persulcatus]